jgi:2-hydroxychromene-2-carboxylate isomerase
VTAIDFWFEFGSTYSYLSAARLGKVADAVGIQVRWRAFLLGPIFAEQGWNDSPFNLYPAKGRYMWRDLKRVYDTLDFPFRRPSEFPRNGLLAARVACRFAASPWLPSFVRAVYRANFEEDLDISSTEVVSGCLASSGEDPAVLLQEAQTPDAKARLRARTEEAARLGIFGAPTFSVGHELFWGNDRLEDALSWAVEHAARVQG